MKESYHLQESNMPLQSNGNLTKEKNDTSCHNQVSPTYDDADHLNNNEKELQLDSSYVINPTKKEQICSIKRRRISTMEEIVPHGFSQYTYRLLLSQRLEYDIRAKEMEEKYDRLRMKREKLQQKLRTTKLQLSQYDNTVIQKAKDLIQTFESLPSTMKEDMDHKYHILEDIDQETSKQKIIGSNSVQDNKNENTSLAKLEQLEQNIRFTMEEKKENMEKLLGEFNGIHQYGNSKLG